MGNLAYLALAVFGLGFLVFIHELGHYFMARRVGMKIESFGIGFGKPIFSFLHKGVRWNICWLPFGGYVKIAGMEKDPSGKEVYDIKEGFFGHTPMQRIWVSLMGPLANLTFALFMLTIIWFAGGREKNYSEVTKKIGFVDTRSELFQKGVRPGDEIISYNGNKVHGFKDHIQAAMMGGDQIAVKGLHYERNTGDMEPFSLDIKPYTPAFSIHSGLKTTGVLAPASYLFYPKNEKKSLPLPPKGSPILMSGMEPGDRIISVDGEKIFSLHHFSYLLNDQRSLLTVRRNDSFCLRRVPRVAIRELRLSREQKDELSDWQWEANLQEKKLQELYFVPYNIDNECVVENKARFIEGEKEELFFPEVFYSSLYEPLQPGDEILAVDGKVCASAEQLFQALQAKYIHIIVQRNPSLLTLTDWEDADTLFEKAIDEKALEELHKSIAKGGKVKEKGDLRLLNPIKPETSEEIFKHSEEKTQFEEALERQRQAIEAITDPAQKKRALQMLEKQQKQLLIGLPAIEDLSVSYNPNPFFMFKEITEEIGATLSALVSGTLSPKWIAGPIGIVQVIHHHWLLGIKEALFWLAIISLNLGLLNLLPLPVLDGGYILLSGFEMMTGKRLPTKTLEKIAIPFLILLVLFFLFLTYNDILRVLTHLFR